MNACHSCETPTAAQIKRGFCLVCHRKIEGADKAPFTLTESEWSLVVQSLRQSREQWSYDCGTMQNTGQPRLADKFLRQYLDAGDLISKIENRP